MEIRPAILMNVLDQCRPIVSEMQTYYSYVHMLSPGILNDTNMMEHSLSYNHAFGVSN